jgi:rhodanese-related sulfurtransferase
MATRKLTLLLVVPAALLAAVALGLWHSHAAAGDGEKAVCPVTGKSLADGPCGAGGATAQKTCPILGKKIDKDLYVDAERHRIYVCCKGCLAKVEADPAAAIATLRERGEKPKDLADCGDACAAPAVASATTEKPAEANPAAVVTTPALKVLLRADVPLVLLDARGQKVKKHLPGAVLTTDRLTANEAKALIPSEDSLVVTYCGSLTCPLSSRLAGRLHELGYKNVLEYSEGLKGWADAGYKTIAREG